VSGNGTLYAWSTMHDRRVHGFADRVPYVNLVVELVEQPLLIVISNLQAPSRSIGSSASPSKSPSRRSTTK